MIKRLRQAHRVAFVFLALAIPVLMTRALASRPAETAPVAVSGALPGIDLSTLNRTWATSLGPIRFRLEASQAPAALLLASIAIPPAPDLLLYWTPRTGSISSIESGDGLLGRLTGTTPESFRLPSQASTGEGTVVLYSLGHDSVIATLPVDSMQAIGP